jgi:hypothetical protein
MSATVEDPVRSGAPPAAVAWGDLTGADVVGALREAAREANRQAARVLRLTCEAARSLGADVTARADEAEQYGADEVRVALVLSHAGPDSGSSWRSASSSGCPRCSSCSRPS